MKQRANTRYRQADDAGMAFRDRGGSACLAQSDQEASFAFSYDLNPLISFEEAFSKRKIPFVHDHSSPIIDSRFRRTLLYALWLGGQICSANLNEILISCCVFLHTPRAGLLEFRSIAEILELANHADSCLLEPYRTRLAQSLEAYQKCASAPSKDSFLQQPSSGPTSNIFGCLWDAWQLEQAQDLSLLPLPSERFTTAEAAELANSDSHLSFYDHQRGAHSRARPPYRRRQEFEAFMDGFLSKLRARSVREWVEGMQRPAPPKAVPPGLARVVGELIEARAARTAATVGEGVLRRVRERYAICDFLRDFVTRGFVLHGSMAYIQDFIQPNQGTCLSGSVAGNLLGVFVTRDPMTAIFCATRKKAEFFNSWAGIDAPGAEKIFVADAELVHSLGHAGWVYVLPPIKNPGGVLETTLSFERCEPLFRVAVIPSDFTARVHPVPQYEIAYNLIVGEARRHRARQLIRTLTLSDQLT